MINWEDRWTNISVLKEANLPSITTTITWHQLQWTGHVIRLPDNHLPKQRLYGQSKEGQLTQGGQKKRSKDNIKTYLRKCCFILNNLEQVALNRDLWSRMANEGTEKLERASHCGAEAKRQQRKGRSTTKVAPQTSTTRTTIHTCPHCNRFCGSWVGLYSLVKTTNDQTNQQEVNHTRFKRSPIMMTD